MSVATTLLKTLAVTIAVLFTAVVVLTTGELFFGSSKIKPLFGMSQDALAQNSLEQRTSKADAGVRPPTYFNATKSAPIPFPRRDADGGL
ncbi:MAG: hypothetical protein ACO1OB_26730 [Archangium sp.]